MSDGETGGAFREWIGGCLEGAIEGMALIEGGKVVEANRALGSLVQEEASRLKGRTVESFLGGDLWARALRQSEAGGREVLAGQVVTASGSRVPVEVRVTARTVEDKAWHLLAVRDLSLLEEMHLRSDSIEQRCRRLFDSMLDGFVTCEVVNDVEGRAIDCVVLTVNCAFLELCSVDEQAVVGRSLTQCLPELSLDWSQVYAEVVQGGEPIRLEKSCRSSERYVEVVAFSPQPGQLAVIFTDVTTRRRLEIRLRQAAKMEAIGTLASGVAHEINNPINVIMNYAALMLRKEITRESIETFAQEIINESERIAVIVRNLLTFARQDSEICTGETVRDIFDAAFSLMRKVLANDRIEVDVDIADDLPRVCCRRQQIEQVFVNLMTNARHALNERFPGSDEKKRLRLEASVVEEDGERWVRVMVEDHGLGISPQVVDRVFDPFFTTKSVGKGTGLGLSVSHGIIEDHHGRLWVESEVGSYTRFFLQLPLEGESCPESSEDEE